jgi:signal peptide peptidase SppA
MKLSNVIAKLYEPLLITPARHAALCQILEARLGGVELAVTSRRERVHDDNPDMDGAEGLEVQEVQEKGSVVVIPVRGTLVRYPEDIAMSECGCALEDLNRMIDAAESDPRIETVIYHFDTPGGSVVGIPETGRKIQHSRKRTVAYTESECCSGGIWLAEQCQHFYGTQSSRIGSVGVYTLAMDYTKALKNEGVKINAISAGKFKLLGAYWKPLGDEERELMQQRVDKIYAQFKEAMETNRVIADKHFGNGLVFDGEEAAALGFTDGVVEDLGEVLELISGE